MRRKNTSRITTSPGRALSAPSHHAGDGAWFEFHTPGISRVASVATVSAATAATAIATAWAVTLWAFGLWACFVDGDGAPHELHLIACRDGSFRLVVVGHVHKSKSAAAPRIAINNHVRIGDLAIGGKERLQVAVGGVVTQVTNVELHRTKPKKNKTRNSPRTRRCHGLLNDRCKSSGVVHGKVGKHLAVDANVLGMERSEKTRIRRPVEPRCRIDAHDPEPSEGAFLRSSVAVGILQALFDVVLGNCPQLRPSAPVPPGTLENPTAFAMCCCFIDTTWHCDASSQLVKHSTVRRTESSQPVQPAETFLLVCGERPSSRSTEKELRADERQIRTINECGVPQRSFPFSILARENMAAVGLLADNFTGCRHFVALFGATVRFHFGHRSSYSSLDCCWMNFWYFLIFSLSGARIIVIVRPSSRMG